MEIHVGDFRYVSTTSNVNDLLFNDLLFGKPSLTVSQTNPDFYVSAVQIFENTAGKGEIARIEQFLLFPQCFLPISMDFQPFSSNLKLSSANSVSLEGSKICRLGKSRTRLYDCCVVL